MRICLILVGLLVCARPARAATISGGDYAGANLSPAGGDVLSGVFQNVGLFRIQAGATVYVDANVPLAVYAGTVSIAGTLEGSGRGRPGGSGGAVNGPGAAGFGGGPTGGGGGASGASATGGGGGGSGGAGGGGSGSGGGMGGASYGSTGTVSIPLSADDIFEGSGGGGGGGSNANPGSPGGSGGAAIYVEAASITVTGAILAPGAGAAAVTNAVFTNNVNAGPGGGGAGGGILLRATSALSLARATLDASGGAGGDVADFNCNTGAPGGGGGGGRIKLFARSAVYASVSLSTAAGTPGRSVGCNNLASPAPTAGAAGTVSFGVVASSPSSFAPQAVYITSVAWSWTAAASFGDASAASRIYRVFPGTATAPLSLPQTTVAAPATAATETGLSPNTTYFRFATAFTDWGDGMPSNAASTHTLAAAPATASLTAASTGSVSFSWTSGSPANPSYTVYEVEAALDSGFSSPFQRGFVVGLSSSPGGLAANTTYFFRVRAVNLDGVPTDFSAPAQTAALAAAPAAPALSGIFVTSASFSWTSVDPSGTQYVAEVSSDNFFSLVASSQTLALSATFFTLTPGTQYFFRAKAVNIQGIASAYSPVISGSAGNLSSTSPPSQPGAPRPDRPFSYDGRIAFVWAPALSTVGILDYELLLGTFPGGNDVFNGTVAAASYTAAGLATGRTYYAQVRARSNAGVVGPFSIVSEGVQVFLPAGTAPIAKAYAWPNPFNPSQGAVQIGFFLATPGDVTFRVYTLNGRLLRRFSQSYAAAGNQIGSWDGADDSGRRAAPGGYIVLVHKSGGDERVKVAVLD